MVGATVTKTRISQNASASGRITVDEIDLDGKFVRLSNKADEVSVMLCVLNSDYCNQMGLGTCLIDFHKREPGITGVC